MSKESTYWARQLTPYHWFVFIIASLAWFFDCLDQRLFSLARVQALADLMKTGDALKEMALASQRVTEQLNGKQIRNVIVVPGKLVNVVIG